MRIILFGANGQIGREIYRTLDRHLPEAEIIAPVRKKRLHFEGCTGDRRHRSVVFDLLHDNPEQLGPADLVINCIGAIEGSDEKEFRLVHHGVTEKLLRHRAGMGFPKIIQLSALGADAGHTSLFLKTKGEADALLLKQPETWVIRPSVVCTPGTRLLEKLRRLKKLSSFLGGYLPAPEAALSASIQPVAGGDLAAVVLACIRRFPEERIIPVTGPEVFRIRELLEICAPGIRVRAVSQRKAELMYFFLRPFLRKLVSREEWKLLRGSNTGDPAQAEKLLNRGMNSTAAFWKSELSDDSVSVSNRLKRNAYVFDVL